jgi:hypothetical protein
MPLAKKEVKAKGNQGAKWPEHSGDGGNVHYLPNAGGTDKSGKKAPTGTASKGKEIARTGRP